MASTKATEKQKKPSSAVTTWLTVNSVLSLGPCSEYTRDRLTEYARGRKRVRATTVLRDKSLPLRARGWLATMLLPELRFWSADRAVRMHAPAALRAAGLTEHADTLAALPEIVDKETAANATNAASAARAAAYHAAAYHHAAYDAAYAANAAANNVAYHAAYHADARVAYHAAYHTAAYDGEWQALLYEAIRRLEAR